MSLLEKGEKYPKLWFTLFEQKQKILKKSFLALGTCDQTIGRQTISRIIVNGVAVLTYRQGSNSAPSSKWLLDWLYSPAKEQWLSIKWLVKV